MARLLSELQRELGEVLTRIDVVAVPTPVDKNNVPDLTPVVKSSEPWPGAVWTAPVPASQTLTVPSGLPDATRVPSSLTATLVRLVVAP